MARLFASEDAIVALLDLTESQGPAVADGIPRESAEALFIPVDVRSQAGVHEVRTTKQTFGRLDAVVNVVGSNRKGRVDSPSVERAAADSNHALGNTARLEEIARAAIFWRPTRRLSSPKRRSSPTAGSRLSRSN